MEQVVSIVTYNVLAGPLATSGYYPAPEYDPEILKLDNRFPKILAKLQKHIETNSIICLQEVDADMSSRIQPELIKHGYNFIYQAYGFFLDGYQGIAIAVPNTYNILAIDKFRIVSGRSWPKLPEHSYYLLKTISILNLFTKIPIFGKYLKSFIVKIQPPDYYNWSNMQRKNNFLLSVLLQKTIEENPFIVSTVHMPCEFDKETNMVVYTGLVKKHIHTLSYGFKGFSDKKYEYILAGDFNIGPKTPAYEYLTTSNGVDEKLFQKYPLVDKWRPTGLPRMTSLMKAVHGKEPEFSCCSCSGSIKTKTPFKGLLDYIFISKGFNATAGSIVTIIPTPFYPNAEEPSDHLLLWGQVILSGKI